MDYSGNKAKLKATSEEGIILQEINENNTGWKVQFSFDDKTLIKRFNDDEITILEKVQHKETILERLARDINSPDLDTQIWSSEILCYFIEDYGNEIETEKLEKTVSAMFNKLSLENEYDIEQKLAEGIFEFLWLEQIDSKSQENLIIKLAELNKDCLFCYLDDEEYLSLKEVKEFVKRKKRNIITAAKPIVGFEVIEHSFP
jgi:hypothetical protein